MSSSDQDRDSYLRWQEFAIAQLGYTINLMMTLSGALLAFVIKGKFDGTIKANGCGWRAALIFLGCSVLFAIVANVSRALDFRYTRQAARARMKNGLDHDEFHSKADCLGGFTWRLFYLQAASFFLGILFLTVSFWTFL